MSAPKSLYTIADDPVLSRDEAESIAKKALAFATADETRIAINSGARGNARFAVNQISTAGDTTNASVTVRSTFGRKSASVTANAVDDESLRSAVRNAEALARLSPEDPEAMPALGPQEYAEGHGWSAPTAGLDPAGRAAAIRAITEASRAAGLVSTGYLETSAGAQAVANNKGLFAYARGTAAALTTTVRTSDGKGSGWAGASHWDWSKIDPTALGATAIQKARASISPVAVEPGRYTVVLEPTAVGNLVQLIGTALSARQADEGRSFFTKPGGGNKIGQKVVSERVTIVTDPNDADSYSAPFTGEGLPTRKVTWIENGVLKNLDYDRYWAQKQGVQPTPAQVSIFGGGGGLSMSGGDATLDELIAGTERGILVTRFWYIRPVDPRTILFTGLTRDGTFLIENGKVTKAVKNLRYNESPIFMLNNVEAMTRPMRVSAGESGSPGSPIVVPSIRTRDFTFTSLSDAV